MPPAEPVSAGPPFVVNARPAPAEMAARQARVAAMLEAAGVDVAVVYGNLASPHAAWYLTGWPPGWDTYVVVAVGDRPRLYVPSPNHLPTALDVAGAFAEVAWAGPHPSATVSDAIRAAVGGNRSTRVGIVGPLPYQVHERLTACLPGLVLVDLTLPMLDLRLVKSAEEIERTRVAARLVDEAIATLQREVRPGLRDFELGAIVEHTYRRLGGEHGICFLASAPMAGGGRTVPAQVWSDRQIGPADMILIELSVYVWGAASQALRTIALGEPPGQLLRLHNVADRTFAALESAVRPGVPAADLLDLAGLIDSEGVTVIDDVVHGYGGGYLPPILRTPATQRRPVPELTLRPGMLLVLQPNVVTPDGSLGVQTGELVAVTDVAAGRFHQLVRGLLHASGSR